MRNAFLALLAKEPAHGYELKQALDAIFGGVWPPLNAGQIYTTLGRLERDGLVRSAHVAQAHRPDKRVYELTPDGRAELEAWIDAPVEGPSLKDEFFMKLVLAQTAGLNSAHDPISLIDRQRRRYFQTLRDLNEAARRADEEGNQTAALLVEGAILHLKADLEWLDLCEQRLTQGGIG
jgi:DNA-binding PadR family transcriptional regulator